MFREQVLGCAAGIVLRKEHDLRSEFDRQSWRLGEFGILGLHFPRSWEVAEQTS
jgi:hypothetical protein